MMFSPESSSAILQQLLKGSESVRRSKLKSIPRIKFGNGHSVSLQASEFHRCRPQNQTGPYSHCEAGYPSKVFPELLPYMNKDEDSNPLKAIYDFVPIEIVMEIIAENGGLAL